tara:strand:+ start:42 stop:542 length:501 start_codon:yes stop_codon:yes gene_type:complete
MKLTQKQWLEKANLLEIESKKNISNREESHRTSDTDGSVTQLDQQLFSVINEKNAKICRNFGKTKFIGLYDGNTRVRAKLIKFICKHSFDEKLSWLLDDKEQIKYKRKFIPYNYEQKTSIIMKKLNLAEREEMDYGWVKCAGLNRYITYRTQNEYGKNAQLKEERT